MWKVIVSCPHCSRTWFPWWTQLIDHFTVNMANLEVKHKETIITLSSICLFATKGLYEFLSNPCFCKKSVEHTLNTFINKVISLVWIKLTEKTQQVFIWIWWWPCSKSFLPSTWIYAMQEASSNAVDSERTVEIDGSSQLINLFCQLLCAQCQALLAPSVFFVGMNW